MYASNIWPRFNILYQYRPIILYHYLSIRINVRHIAGSLNSAGIATSVVVSIYIVGCRIKMSGTLPISKFRTCTGGDTAGKQISDVLFLRSSSAERVFYQIRGQGVTWCPDQVPFRQLLCCCRNGGHSAARVHTKA
jgi:hypothetical protein